MDIESKIWKYSNTGTKLHAFENGVALCRTSIRRFTSDAGVDYCEAADGYVLCRKCDEKFNAIIDRIEASMQPSTGEGDYLPPAEDTYRNEWAEEQQAAAEDHMAEQRSVEGVVALVYTLGGYYLAKDRHPDSRVFGHESVVRIIQDLNEFGMGAAVVDYADGSGWCIEVTSREGVVHRRYYFLGQNAEVADVRASGINKLFEAEELEAKGSDPVQIPRMRHGQRAGWIIRHASDPRHPVQAAVQLRRAAAKLMAWTEADEDGYLKYLSDGQADTDGWFAPEPREAWKK